MEQKKKRKCFGCMDCYITEDCSTCDDTDECFKKSFEGLENGNA